MMRRSGTTNNDGDINQSQTKTTDTNNHQSKRSLEDYGFSANSKRRRHLSPQNSNIDVNTEIDTTSSPSVKRKTRTKAKNHSILNSSIETYNEHDSNIDSPTSRKATTRYTSSLSSQQINEISLPNWERICPNIDQILSTKHTQSGVFAHEVQLVQQELEALLSMAIVRENILKHISAPTVNSSDTIRSKIRRHQEAERIYSSKKPLDKPSLTNQQQQRQNGSNVLLDRQVTMAPVSVAKIDRIWSDINTYYRKISSNDISTIENLVEYHQNLQNKFEKLKSEYNTQTLDQTDIVEKLNEETYQQLIEMSQINSLITHYVDRTTVGTFQNKLYEHMGQISPVYKTPVSSPMHGRLLANNSEFKDHNSSLRISPRLHPNEMLNSRFSLFSLPNAKSEDEFDTPLTTNSSIKSKKKNKFSSSPSSTIKFHQRLQFVQNYLIDQHPSINDNVKRQLFTDGKSTKKRKNSTSNPLPPIIPNIDQCTNVFQSKLSTIISLLNECSTISSCALKRARIQSNNEQTWQKLNTIERDLELFIEKFHTTGGHSTSSNTEKAFQNLDQLVIDWQKCEEEFNQQLNELPIFDQ